MAALSTLQMSSFKLFNPEPKLSLPQVNWSSSKLSEVALCQLCPNLIEVHPMLNSP